MKTVQEIEDSKRRSPLEVFFFILVVLLIAMLVSALSNTAFAQEYQSDGETVYTEVCSSCHSLKPTATGKMPIAPPMAMISKRYVKMTGSMDAARVALLSWLIEPDSAKSLMPTKAIEHHGIMPSIQLSEDQRLAVADFILGLSESGESTQRKGMTMRHGAMEGKGDNEGGREGHRMGMKHNEGQTGMSGMQGNMECSMHGAADSTSTATTKGCKGMKKGMNNECSMKSGGGKMGSGNGHAHGNKGAAQDSTATAMSECKMMNHKKN